MFQHVKVKWKLVISSFLLLPVIVLTILFFVERINETEEKMRVMKQNSKNQEIMLQFTTLLQEQENNITEYSVNRDSAILSKISIHNAKLIRKVSELHVNGNENKLALKRLETATRSALVIFTTDSSASEAASNLQARYESVSNYVTDLSTNLTNDNEELQKTTEAELKTMKQNMVIGVSVILSLYAIMQYYLIAKFSSRITRLMNVSNDIARGNLRAHIENEGSRDEIGHLAESIENIASNFRSILKKTNHMIEEIASSAEQLSVSTSQTSKTNDHITKSIQEIAEGSEKQHLVTSENAEKAQVMNEEITEVMDNIDRLTKESSGTRESILQGNTLMMESVGKMNEIDERSYTLEKTVRDLAEQSKEIVSIATFITEISKKTDLLSLNANIQASRAGVAGLGFGVVADEIKKLAEQSTVSAERINHIIYKMKDRIDSVIYEVSKNRQVVGEGKHLAHETGKTFESITATINNISEEIRTINEASKGIQQTTNNMVSSINGVKSISIENTTHTQNVASATEEQNASMSEIVSSSERLAQLGDELRRETDVFKV